MVFRFRSTEPRVVFSTETFFIIFVLAATLAGQVPCPDGLVSCSSVPRLVRFTGVLVDTGGRPRTGVVGITFSIYSHATGGVALWHETQNVALDNQGRYAVLLGMTEAEGLPTEIFSAPEPRWVGVWPQLDGEVEHPRALLASVPYALKAADAETIQGLPASAFLRAPTSLQTSNSTPSSVSVSSPGVAAASVPSTKTATGAATEFPMTTSGGVVNAVPKFDSATSTVPSQISDLNGMVQMQNLANILFADQFAGGVPDAIKACPAAGCIVYAYSPYTNLNLGSFDPGGKAVTLYLGPYQYTVTQITLESDLKIIGMGAGITALQSADGTKPVFVVPQATNGVAQHVLLSGFHIYGAPGNKGQDAILLDSSGYYNAGIWYSELHDVIVTGFSGDGIHLKGTSANFSGMTQFTEFNRVLVFRTKGGGNALRIEGAAYELYFNDCEFDGSGPGDGVNIFIGGSPPSTYAIPIDINFRGLTSQNAATAVQIDGGWALSFYSPHHEYVWGVYSVADDLGLVDGITISDAGFQTSGSNGGAGYLLNVLTARALGIRFIHNHIMGPADSVVRAANGASIVYQDNLFVGGTTLPLTSGITTQVTASSTINIGGAHTIGVSASTTPISTIQANLGAGEIATFYALTGPITFTSGGNINLMGPSSLSVDGSITFVITDLGKVPSWIPVSQWAPPLFSSLSSVPLYSLLVFPTNLVMPAGTKGTVDLSLTPENGFVGSVSFTCSVTSPEISCSVAPNAVSLENANPKTTSVLITARSSMLSGKSRSVGPRRAKLLPDHGVIVPPRYQPMVTVRATSGNYSRSISFSVTVE